MNQIIIQYGWLRLRDPFFDKVYLLRADPQPWRLDLDFYDMSGRRREYMRMGVRKSTED